ncbi:hypothetical protein EDD11_006221 [Mortierella claussenii]|nr:hypothetical protein EDD11_006221 [Mortierella claussenii]
MFIKTGKTMCIFLERQMLAEEDMAVDDQLISEFCYVPSCSLLEWLEHSNKRYCELCKHSFAFTPIYSPEMPETIPRGMLIGRALERLGKLTCLILRGILVTTIWLVILPYFTIWIWRLYFWIGETFAFRVNGLETPLWNSTMFFSTQPNITVSKPVSAFAPERRISLLIFQGLAPEYQWVSKFILDCFEGQVISSVVVIMFVALFLLREWVLQNQNADRARVAVDDAAAPAVGAEPEAQGFNVEHAVERFIAVQRRIEAVVEGEADLSDEDSDEVSDEELEQIQERTQSPPAVSSAAQQPTTPVEHWNLIDFQNTAEAAREERNSITAEHRPKFFWETGATGGAGSSARPMPLPPTIAPVESGLSALGATSASSGLASCEETGSRSTNERTCPSNLTTEIYTSAPTIDRSGKRPGTLHGRLNQGISYRAPEDMPNLDDMPTATPRVEYVYDSLNQTYHPDTRSVSSPSPPEPASVTYSSNDGQRGSGPNRLWIGQNFLAADNGEGSSGELRQIQGSLKDNIRSQGGSPLYWKAGIPLTYENVYVKEDGSGMSFSEKAARYEELCRTGVLAFADESRLSSLRQDTQTHQASAEQLQQLAQVQQERQDVIHRINERGIRMRLRDNGVAPQPDENPGQAAALPRPPQVRRPAVMAPAAPPPVDDELEEFNVEELDGVLELIGMHGSYWILLQNSLLMSALICASLGVGIWIPFMIGKTILLMNPFNFLRVPFVLLSRLTDPVLDYMFDRMLPYASATASKTAAVLRSNLSPHVILMVESYLGGTALKPFAVMFEDHILPTWHAIMEITATSAPQGVTSKDSLTVVIEAMEPASNATLAVNTVTDSANTPVVHHVVRQWGELAYGTTSGNKLAAIVVGYAVLVAMAFWYFLRTQHSYGHRFSRAARSILCQCGLIVKIIFFVGIEMVVFPLFCGFVIDLSTLPLFKGASAASRIAFYKLSPNWSLIMHWLVGTAFMFNISVFVSLCRSMVRPGVMWFVRDPNDEGFHPIREILERPVILLLRKLGSGVLMYLALILLGVTFTIHSINLMLSGVLPLRWPVE